MRGGIVDLELPYPTIHMLLSGIVYSNLDTLL